MMKRQKIRPRNESRKKMQPYTREAFHALLKKAVKTPVSKAAKQRTTA